jgi:ribosomal protein L37AE/L43A
MEVIYRCNKCDDFESSDINIAVVHRCAPKLEVPPANGEQQAQPAICPNCGRPVFQHVNGGEYHCVVASCLWSGKLQAGAQ